MNEMTQQVQRKKSKAPIVIMYIVLFIALIGFGVAAFTNQMKLKNDAPVVTDYQGYSQAVANEEFVTLEIAKDNIYDIGYGYKIVRSKLGVEMSARNFYYFITIIEDRFLPIHISEKDFEKLDIENLETIKLTGTFKPLSEDNMNGIKRALIEEGAATMDNMPLEYYEFNTQTATSANSTYLFGMLFSFIMIMFLTKMLSKAKKLERQMAEQQAKDQENTTL